MPPPNYMAPTYSGAMDPSNHFNYAALDSFAPVYSPGNAPVGKGGGTNSGLSVRELGTTLNPMQHQLHALQAKIREGASKVEFEFAGRGKGSSQASTPESYGKDEREIMRQLASLNDIESSTHATFNVAGLAGFGQRGFNRQAQQDSMKEVQRAIDFARDATTGGAIVVHTGEWNRPVSPYYGEGKWKFSSYEQEDQDAPLYVADRETGEIVDGISRNRKVAIPKWHTAKSWEEKIGKPVVGQKRVDVNGNELGGVIGAEEFVDMSGNVVNPDDPMQMGKRMPVFKDDGSGFEMEDLGWDQLEKMKDQWNKEHPDNIKSTEKIFAELQIDNNILNTKGSSLYYSQDYEKQQEMWFKLEKALEFYNRLDASLPEDEKQQLMINMGHQSNLAPLLEKVLPANQRPIPDIIRDEMSRVQRSLQMMHEQTAAADARLVELERKRGNIASLEEVGLERTGEALARLADEAMEKSKQAREMRKPGEKWEDLFIAPENWHPGQFGSHPDELIAIVDAGREKFKRRLREKYHMDDEKKMQELAERHIKTTFDIGHLNMWRSMMERNPNESDEKFQARFNEWVTMHLEKLHKKKAIGHLHLTDNFGYDDEHISIGQGNAPVKEFVDWMAKKGYKDFIIEPGSFNGQTITPDAWSYLGAVNWQTRQGMGFRDQRGAHTGLYAPPTYIVGAYIPSNEWTLWSGVQLE